MKLELGSGLRFAILSTDQSDRNEAVTNHLIENRKIGWVGRLLPARRLSFAFSVGRLVSRRCHIISTFHQLVSCPSQNRACAINAHGSPDNHSDSDRTGEPARVVVAAGNAAATAWTLPTGNSVAGCADSTTCTTAWLFRDRPLFSLCR